jgi:hypothetical protein
MHMCRTSEKYISRFLLFYVENYTLQPHKSLVKYDIKETNCVNFTIPNKTNHTQILAKL